MADIIQIDSHTWRFEDDFVRFFLLEGTEKAALIDSGANSPNALTLAKTLTDKPIILLNTHGDGDHISGTGAFSEIYMHESDYGRKVSSQFPDVVLIKVNDNDVIDLGDRPVTAIHIPGHTYGSLAFLDAKERVLYAGDSVQKGHIYMFGDHRDPKQFEASLNKLIEMTDRFDKIYASHDEFCIPSDYIKKVKDAWIQVQNGNVTYEIIDLYGNHIKSYTTDICGFYMNEAIG